MSYDEIGVDVKRVKSVICDRVGDLAKGGWVTEPMVKGQARAHELTPKAVTWLTDSGYLPRDIFVK